MKSDVSSKLNPDAIDDKQCAAQYRWIAHELHDGLLQWVVGARMQVEAAALKLSKDSEAAANLEQAVVHLLNALEEGRGLIGFLENQELGDCDAVVSVASFIESMQYLAAQRQQTLHFDGPEPGWPSIANPQAWSILRFVQQAVQNAIQHAGPANIDVCLGWTSKQSPEPAIFAVVQDNGRGFDSTVEAPAGHFGLQSLQQRANMCGGRFTLETAIGAGCRVELEVPVVSVREV